MSGNIYAEVSSSLLPRGLLLGLIPQIVDSKAAMTKMEQAESSDMSSTAGQDLSFARHIFSASAFESLLVKAACGVLGSGGIKSVTGR